MRYTNPQFTLLYFTDRWTGDLEVIESKQTCNLHDYSILVITSSFTYCIRLSQLTIYGIRKSKRRCLVEEKLRENNGR